MRRVLTNQIRLCNNFNREAAGTSGHKEPWKLPKGLYKKYRKSARVRISWKRVEANFIDYNTLWEAERSSFSLKKLKAIYRNRSFNIIYTNVSWATRINPVSMRSVLILSAHGRIHLPNGFIPSFFSPSKPYMYFSSTQHMPHFSSVQHMPHFPLYPTHATFLLYTTHATFLLCTAYVTFLLYKTHATDL